MIDFAYAETAEEIRRLLRSQTGIVVRAPRKSGKTTELIKFAEEKYPFGKFAVVCLNQEMNKCIIRMHWTIFNRISQADIVAKRLMGEPLGGVDINPPLMINMSNFYLLRSRGLPVFVDEYGSFDENTQNAILDSGQFVAGVTS